MAEVAGISKLFSGSPDAADLEREISNIRAAKDDEFDHAADFHERLKALTSGAGIDIPSSATKSSSTPKRPELPRASNQGPMLDFTNKPAASWDKPAPAQTWSAPTINDRHDRDRGDARHHRSRSRSRSRSVSSRRSRSTDSSASLASSVDSRMYDPDNIDAAIDEMQTGPLNDDVDARTERTITELICEIDIYRNSLTTLGTDVSQIPDVNPSMTMFEIKRVHALVEHLFNKEAYTDFATDVLLLGSNMLEASFDGQRYFLGKVPINYTGLSNAYALKLSQNKPGLKHAVSEVAKKTGVNPSMIMLGKFIMPLVSIPLENSRKTSLVRNQASQRVLGQLH